MISRLTHLHLSLSLTKACLSIFPIALFLSLFTLLTTNLAYVQRERNRAREKENQQYIPFYFPFIRYLSIYETYTGQDGNFQNPKKSSQHLESGSVSWLGWPASRTIITLLVIAGREKCGVENIIEREKQKSERKKKKGGKIEKE